MQLNSPSVAIGFGSNLRDRPANLRAGWKALRQVLVDSVCSGVYESAPLHVPDQPQYLNACCVGHTDLSPSQLLAELHQFENEAGRDRSAIRYGPRTLDLDLLMYGQQRVRTPELILPHPRMLERAFVLIPLAEIAADWTVPGTATTVGQLAAKTDPTGVTRTQWSLSEAL